MPDIVLSTLNAKYIHAAFGLRYLLANLGPLRSRATILEFEVAQRPVDIAEAILAQAPQVVGLGVYIWNAGPTAELVAILKRLKPELVVILGGPEVSYEWEDQPSVRWADHLITGEADLAFAELVTDILQRGGSAPKIIHASLPEFVRIQLPYAYYTDQDIAHRLIYVEASRGCPFTCEFCLSSLDIPVRQAPLPEFLSAMGNLLDRGARHLKFVDRTFNLNLHTAQAILEFLLRRYEPGLFFHFEMVPDRLPDPLRNLIRQFPPGALQFEVGIQTFNPDVATRIRRRQNYEKLADNLQFLRRETGVHLHADLIAGLPGESLASFAAGFDRLVALAPHEIQVGILKRLRGTPIARHDAEWEMIWNPQPPCEILRNQQLDFPTMQRLRRFARYWDLVGNSGNFVESLPWFWAAGPGDREGPSPFEAFWKFCEWLFSKVGRTDSIALGRLMELSYHWLTTERHLDPPLVAATLRRDYQRGGRQDTPRFLADALPPDAPRTLVAMPAHLPKRQARHLAAQPSAKPNPP